MAAKYYGPFEFLEKVGKVAYRLRLLDGSKIHPVFHVSQLKQALGTFVPIMVLPPSFWVNGEVVIEPEKVLETHHTADGVLEVLIQWVGLPQLESSWVLGWELPNQFPTIQLEDKLRFIGYGSDTLQRIYFHKKKHNGEEKKGQVEIDCGTERVEKDSE